MEDGSILGDVDLLSREHRVDPFREPHLLGELHEELHGPRGEPIFRVIEEQVVEVE